MCVLALTGCSVAPDMPRNENGVTILVRQDRPETIMTAVVEGTLSVVNDACLGIDTGDGVLVTVFPAGTSFAGKDGVDIPNLGTVRIGDPIRTRGGFLPLSSSPIEIPDDCVTDELIEIMP